MNHSTFGLQNTQLTARAAGSWDVLCVSGQARLATQLVVHPVSNFGEQLEGSY